MILDEKRNIKILKYLKGKTIVSAEFIESEMWGKSKYIGFVFTDGTRMLVNAEFSYKTDPEYEVMKEHPNFFDPEDLAEKVERDEVEIRERKKREIQSERREYEKLKEKFESDKE